MGKSKSKMAGDEKNAFEERRANVNKLIQRMNSRGEPVRNDNNDVIRINTNPFLNTELRCCEPPVDDFSTPERDTDVIILKKQDSIDNIIDLIVDKSLKREQELREAKRREVKRSHTYHAGEKRDRMKVRYKEDGSDILTDRFDHFNERTEIFGKRVDNLKERAEIFQKRVDRLDEWLASRESEFDRNMLDVLGKTEEEINCDSDRLKTIERVSGRELSVTNELIAAPKADPIIRNTIGKLLDEDGLRDPSRRQRSGKTYCANCKKKCTGEVLRVQDKYFHISCFKCKTCKSSLAQGGFFFKDNAYYCTNDYQRQYGTKCASCGQYVEGEVVNALGNTYHQKCFTCARCRTPFPSGERVTYTGKEVLCQKCSQTSNKGAVSPTSPSQNECAGCREEIKHCLALSAFDKQWHLACFKCTTCGVVLQGEYMGKDGVPYCEKDYQKQFGVKCAYCYRYVSGKVLQAGDNHHFHPSCARCTKCGDPFGDGEEMYLQGGAIWHPKCGPGPTDNGTILNGGLENGHVTDTDGEISARDGRDFDRMSSSALSDAQFSYRSRASSVYGSMCSPSNSLNRKYAYQRTGSPGLILREYKSQQFSEDISRIYTYSYLTEEPSYLKKPIDPYDKPPTSPHFHRPSSSQSLRSSSYKPAHKSSSRSGMRAMAESIRSETPRPRSPHMNNEEPIELAHFPDGRRPDPTKLPKIERDDFPAPPYPYSDPERRKKYAENYKGLSDDEEDEVDGTKGAEEDRFKKEEEELSKIATGIGKVFLKNVKEREKLRQWKMQHLDPRNASRVAAANKEPINRLRYQSPVNASPSRNSDHPRPWEEEEYDRSSSYRSSVGRSVGAIPSYNAYPSRPESVSRKSATLPTNRYISGYSSDYGVGYNGPDIVLSVKVVSALRHVPKPGYGLAPRSHTFSSAGGSFSNIGGDFSFSGIGDKTHSTEFSSGKSDISIGGSISEVDRRGLSENIPGSATFQGIPYSSYSPHLRRSLPTLSHMNNEPPKIYPYHLIMITNYRLPSDVDRCNLEYHLSDAEFERVFQCTRTDFYRLPAWRRNEMKRRAKLF